MSKLNFFQRFLLWSAGANPKILEREEWLSERYKYSAIGATVALTAVMEFLSGGYALFTVFRSPAMFGLGGLAWSSIVFNLDRFFILSSTRKKGDSVIAFAAASCLRIVIAILLGFIVAKPLELRLFKPEIDREVSKSLLLKKQELDNTFANSPLSLQIEEKKKEINLLKRENAETLANWKESNSRAIEEATGESGTGKVGKGFVFQEKQDQADRLYQHYLQVQQSNDQEINRVQEELDQLINARHDERAQFQVQQQTLESGEGNIGSLLDRLAALDALGKDNPTIAATNKLITALFIILEVSPILVKILSSRGPYEDFLEQEERYEMPRQYLQELENKKMEAVGNALQNSLQNTKDFEIKIEEIKSTYLREKERNRERILNIDSPEIREIIDERFGRELSKFLALCDKDRDLYEAIALNFIQKAANLNSKETVISTLKEFKVNENSHGSYETTPFDRAAS